MQLATLVIIFLTYNNMEQCLSEILLNTFETNQSSSVFDAAVDVFKFCYGNRVNTVGLAGDFPDFLIKSLTSKTQTTVVLLKNIKRLTNNAFDSRKYSHRLQVFMATASSTFRLKRIFTKMKSSLWWNHMASLFIIEQPLMTKYGCSDASDVLMATWKSGLLSAKFICHHPSKGRLMYTYNPYTGYAPDPWQIANISTDLVEHPWTLFVRSYDNASRFCEQLDYDKTINLGGYPITSIVNQNIKSWYVIPNKTGIDSFGGSSGITARIIHRAMNATPKFLVDTEISGFSLKNEKKSDIADEVSEGKGDIGWNSRYQLTMLNRSTSYPLCYSGIAVVTQSKGYASQLSNVCSILDIKEQYLVYAVIVITVGLFRCFGGRTLMHAILNTIRIICNMSLPRMPDSQASRIYLASLFMFAIIIQNVYQGELASMLMKREILADVDTKEDLMRSGHTIYGYKTYARFFDESDFDDRFIALDHFSCIRYVLNDSTAACVKDRSFIIDDAMNKKLHLSSEMIIDMPIIYVVRPDWPLLSRLDKILFSLVEAGIVKHHSLEQYRKSSEFFEFNKKLQRIEKFRVMTLSDLTFAFVILAVGLACATLSFSLELIVKQTYS